MSWFLVVCLKTALSGPCEEHLRMRLDPKVGERVYIETMCSEIKNALKLKKLEPTEFHCEYIGDKE